MKFGLILLTFLFSTPFFAQLKFDRVEHSFGELSAQSERFVDFKVTNVGKKKEYLLRVQKPNEVVYIASGQFIEPDSSLLLRFQVNPKKTGKFNYEIPVFTSDRAEAVVLKLSGNLKELSNDPLASFQNCPDFSAVPSTSATDFKLTVVTLDKETKELLAKSTVSLLQNGRGIGSWKTGKNGSFSDRVPLGYTYFYATHDGYFPSEKGMYINFQRNYVEIELAKNPAICLPFPAPKKDSVPELIVEQQVPLQIETQLYSDNPTPPAQPLETDYQKIPFENFDETHFKPINVVFVLDISGSMRVGDRMELLKFSLNQLVDVLRPVDRMAIITYADKAKVLVPSKNGDQKAALKDPIAQLKAEGYTAGGDGIALGYKQMNKNFLENGANHVIIITDGAFNKNSDEYKKVIEKYKSKGVTFSVVGIQNTEKDAAKMKEAAEVGNGRYTAIDKLSDAQINLIQEIRLATFKGNVK